MVINRLIICLCWQRRQVRREFVPLNGKDAEEDNPHFFRIGMVGLPAVVAAAEMVATVQENYKAQV